MAHDVKGVGANLDAGADFGERGGLLVNLDIMPRLHEAGGRRQSANSSSGNDYFR